MHNGNVILMWILNLQINYQPHQRNSQSLQALRWEGKGPNVTNRTLAIHVQQRKLTKKTTRNNCILPDLFANFIYCNFLLGSVCCMAGLLSMAHGHYNYKLLLLYFEKYMYLYCIYKCPVIDNYRSITKMIITGEENTNLTN